MAYSRTAAPGEVARLETFCNSARFLYDEDAFADVTSAGKWLREHEMAVPELTERDLRRLVQVREAIRDHLGGQSSPVLNRYARTVFTTPQWTPDGWPVLATRASGGVLGLIGQVLAVLFTADLTGETARLKPCRAPECRWLFYDRSPGRNSVWCSMEICGARHKMRNYRARQA
jgi:predicted RNA-binding Zn ribbon-like protein